MHPQNTKPIARRRKHRRVASQLPEQNDDSASETSSLLLEPDTDIWQDIPDSVLDAGDEQDSFDLDALFNPTEDASTAAGFNMYEFKDYLQIDDSPAIASTEEMTVPLASGPELRGKSDPMSIVTQAQSSSASGSFPTHGYDGSLSSMGEIPNPPSSAEIKKEVSPTLDDVAVLGNTPTETIAIVPSIERRLPLTTKRLETAGIVGIKREALSPLELQAQRAPLFNNMFRGRSKDFRAQASRDGSRKRVKSTSLAPLSKR